MRPRLRVRFPWKLTIGDRSWIGEGVWIHNQDEVRIGHDVVLSQEAFLTTGSHAHRRDMALVTAPIEISDGVWVTSRAMVLGGTRIGTSTLVGPMSVVKGDIAENMIVRGNPGVTIGRRFTRTGDNGEGAAEA
jgi:putative colanic acid biosynthesis acetyltransferase WcaF